MSGRRVREWAQEWQCVLECVRERVEVWAREWARASVHELEPVRERMQEREWV